MLRFVILCTAVVAYVLAAKTTTHRPHGHHHTHDTHTTSEPYEHDNIRFHYDPYSHKMVVATGSICYVLVLTDAERVAVHTEDGLRALELKLLGLLSTGTLVYVNQLEVSVQELCGIGTADYYMLQRA